jgi:hypothetical protein
MIYTYEQMRLRSLSKTSQEVINLNVQLKEEKLFLESVIKGHEIIFVL